MADVIVNIPASFEAERKYIVQTLFEEFVGASVEIQVHGNTGYLISGNGKSFEIVDNFFGGIPDNETYVKAELLPKTASYFNSETYGNALPILFGKDEILQVDTVPSIHFDVFASAFFMLTRWEEALPGSVDEHERFNGAASIAYQWGFLDRPVVNYYGKLIREWLTQFLGLDISFNRKPRVFLTHDVDSPRLWTSITAFMQQQFLAILKHHDVGQYFRNYGSYFKGAKKDPWNRFDLFMAQAESLDIAAHFYFIPDGTLSHETHYKLTDPSIIELFQRIRERGHLIGFHPSYHTMGDPELLSNQKQMLEDASEARITAGRQHYLRFKAPDTWRHWDAIGMEVDSTMYYAKEGGYRCGACSEFSLFDVVEREPLTLKELPLTMMEATFVHYNGTAPEEMKKTVQASMNEVRELNGDYVSLWHNSSFYTPEFKKYESVQSWMIEELKQLF